MKLREKLQREVVQGIDVHRHISYPIWSLFIKKISFPSLLFYRFKDYIKDDISNIRNQK
jgi:hypothetical protein